MPVLWGRKEVLTLSEAAEALSSVTNVDYSSGHCVSWSWNWMCLHKRQQLCQRILDHVWAAGEISDQHVNRNDDVSVAFRECPVCGCKKHVSRVLRNRHVAVSGHPFDHICEGFEPQRGCSLNLAFVKQLDGLFLLPLVFSESLSPFLLHRELFLSVSLYLIPSDYPYMVSSHSPTDPCPYFCLLLL